MSEQTLRWIKIIDGQEAYIRCPKCDYEWWGNVSMPITKAVIEWKSCPHCGRKLLPPEEE